MARPLVRSLLCATLVVGAIVATSAGAQARPARTAGPPFSSLVRDLSGNDAESSAISCLENGLCVVVGYTGKIYAISGEHAQQLASTGISLFAVSCATRTFCMAMGNDLSLELLSRRPRELPLGGFPLDGEVQWSSVSCPTTSFCMAGGEIVTGPHHGAAAVARWNGSYWSSLAVIDPPRTRVATNSIGSVSCVTTRFCIGADNNGKTFQWNGSHWSAAAPLDAPAIGDSFHVSCTSASFCLALGIGTSDVFAWNGRTWKREAAPDLPWGYGVVGCATPRFCIGTDDGGRASAWNGEKWSRPTTVDDEEHPGFGAISCTTTTCEAVTGSGRFIYFYTGKRPPKQPMPCDEVHCPGTLA